MRSVGSVGHSRRADNDEEQRAVLRVPRDGVRAMRDQAAPGAVKDLPRGTKGQQAHQNHERASEHQRHRDPALQRQRGPQATVGVGEGLGHRQSAQQAREQVDRQGEPEHLDVEGNHDATKNPDRAPLPHSYGLQKREGEHHEPDTRGARRNRSSS